MATEIEILEATKTKRGVRMGLRVNAEGLTATEAGLSHAGWELEGDDTNNRGLKTTPPRNQGMQTTKSLACEPVNGEETEVECQLETENGRGATSLSKIQSGWMLQSWKIRNKSIPKRIFNGGKKE
jgi:hypothetical protein